MFHTVQLSQGELCHTRVGDVSAVAPLRRVTVDR